ncbi:MAG: alpha/beta fold hydrolase [Chthoniobacteraceae bacterium]
MQRFDNVAAKANNSPADSVLGQAAFTTSAAGSGPGGLDTAQALALGANGRLWIADQNNHRVVRHEAAHTKVNGADADSVLGAPATTTDLTRRFRPQGVAIDPVSGKLFVSDDQRNRVLRFASVAALTSGAGAEAVFGQADFSGGAAATAANRMSDPSGLTVDSYGNLWVADEGNRRVLRFNNAAQRASGTAADGVLGQPNFTSNAGLPRSAGTMGLIRAVAPGLAGELWVSDGILVLRFDNARMKGNGAPADGVLGQGNFTSSIQSLDAYHFGARGIALDASGRLWVNDYSHNRVLRFDNAAAKMDGAAANGVLGQSSFFTDNAGGLGPDGVFYSTLLTEPGGRLWLVDGNKNRALRWEDAAARPNGADADGLLGQPDFGFGDRGAGPGQFSYPFDMARDATGHLWIADRENERIVRYSPQTPRLTIAPKNANTVTLTMDGQARGVAYFVEVSLNLKNWTPAPAFIASSNDPIIFDARWIPAGANSSASSNRDPHMRSIRSNAQEKLAHNMITKTLPITATVAHRGCHLAYSVCGDGTPVILIQGVAVHGGGWHPQVEVLAPRYRCLTFDNRGLGQSQPIGAGKISVEQMAEDARRLMDEMRWNAAHVVGHSLGGLIALELALANPARVRSLALLCTFGRGCDAAPLTARMLWTGMRTRIGSRRQRRRAFLELVMPPGALRGIDADALAARMALLFGHDLADQPDVTGLQLAAMRTYDAMPRLHELASVPTLVVSAAHDPIAPPSAGRALANAIPNARFVELADTSHGVPIHSPERINELLSEHFAHAEQLSLGQSK